MREGCWVRDGAIFIRLHDPGNSGAMLGEEEVGARRRDGDHAGWCGELMAAACGLREYARRKYFDHAFLWHGGSGVFQA